jgi:hypothetical protein
MAALSFEDQSYHQFSEATFEDRSEHLRRRDNEIFCRLLEYEQQLLSIRRSNHHRVYRARYHHKHLSD